MKKITFFIVLLLFSSQLFSQITIMGKVTDAITGEPLPVATVQIAGTTIGTTTDFDGLYSIEVRSDADILKVSFIGYLPQSLTVGDQTQMNFSLEEDVLKLNEVVVTALGIKREKKALGYSVQDVKGDELEKANPENVVSALSGRIAGAQVVTSSGQLGSSSTIKIRGNKTFSGSNQPLFVVDGTPIMNSISSAQESSTYTDFGNAAMDIDPSEIESISVLKGASASALYGSRGANGVVLITTKKGSKKKGIGVEFSTSFDFNNVYLLPNYQNEYGQGRNGSEYEWKNNYSDLSYQEFHDEREFRWAMDGSGYRMDWDESWGSRLDAGLMVAQMDSPLNGNGEYTPTPWISRPDNVKDYYETGISSVNNLALTSITDKSQTRLTLGYTTQKGTSPNTDQRKINLGLKTHNDLTDKLSFDVNFNYGNLRNENMPQQGNTMRNPLLEFNSWFGRQVNTQYLEDHYNDIVDYEGTPTSFNWMMAYSSQHPNPYWNAYKNTMSRDRNRVYGNAAINYEFVPGFTLTGRIGTDFFNEHRQYKYHKYSRDWTDMYEFATNGNFWEQHRMESETNADLLLNIDKNISDNITFFGIVGGNWRMNFDQFASTHGSNLIVADFFSTSNYDGEPSVSFTKYKKITNSVFASANFGYKRYLYFDVSLRGDWSSALPKGNWNYWYPAANLGFIITEAFSIESDVFSYGKLRAGYAVVGNDTYPYRLRPTFSPIGTSFGDINLFGVQPTLPTYSLMPEMTYSFETGAEFKFFQNRLGFDLTYYNAITRNQILLVDIPYSSGYMGWIKNAGSIRNTGFELLLYGTIIEMKDFSWDASINWATNKNTIEELTDGLDRLQLSYFYRGTSLMAFPGEEWGQIYGTTFERNGDGKIIIDEDGMPQEAVDPEVLGSVNPNWFGGIRNTFTFKNFTLSALVDFRKGGDIFSMTKAVGQKAGILQATVENDQRVNGMIVDGVYQNGAMVDLNGDGSLQDASGMANQTTISSRSYWRNSRDWGELSIVDGSFIKLRELTLAYRLPKTFVRKMNLQNVTVSAYGRNLALLYTHKSNDAHIDPEVSTGGTVGGTGLEAYQLPPTRTIGFKLNVKF